MTKPLQSKRANALVHKTLRALALLALGTAGPLAWTAGADSAVSTPAGASLPTLGDGSELSSGDERRLGDQIARELYRDPDYLDDPVLVEYVQDIWQPLLAAARARGDLTPELDARFAWEIMLGRDRTVNAFALPGGYLGVHLGLIAIVSNRAELASVLGHELSHVTQRHISRLIAQQGRQTPWLIGSMILGALAASRSIDAANALIVGGQAVTAQNQLNFSRDMEREADRVGFNVMTQAGFEAQGFVTMFGKLQQASRLNDNGAFPYLRSHPLTTERIADMQSRQPLGGSEPVSVPPTMEHAMVTARARVLSNPGVDALRALRLNADGAQLAARAPAQQAGVLYGAALAAGSLRDFAKAALYLQRLHPLVQGDLRAARLARLLQAEIALAAGSASQAGAALQSNLASQTTRPELLLETQIAVQSGQHAAVHNVTQRLQLWVAAHPTDAQAWQLLAGAYTVQRQSLRAIRADAESQVARLDYAGALDRLRAAQELLRSPPARPAVDAASEHIEASIIDTRRRQIELRLKEQALER